MSEGAPTREPGGPAAGRPIEVLLVEDAEVDAILVVRELRRGGFDVRFERVDTPESMAAALVRKRWDLIISDYSMPRFSAPRALALVREHQLDLPFIIVSGTVGEETAVAAMRAGAHDFMAKGRLGRLNPAIERELREAGLRAERERMRQEVEVTRGRLEAVFAFAPVSILVVDRSGRIQFLNRTLPPSRHEERVGTCWVDTVAEDERPRIGALLDAVLDGGESQGFETSVLRADGTRGWYAGVMGPIRDGAQVGGVVICMQDVTDLKRGQERLRVSDRMAGVGALAAGVAHDFNNILSVILSFGVFVRDDLPEGDPRRADMEEVLGAAERAVGLTRQLLAFSRQQPRSRRPTDLNERLTQLQGILVRTIGSHIELVFTRAATAAVVLLDPVEFDQILLNLAVNARDAMPDGGRLEIGLAVVRGGREGPGGAEGGLVRLTVTDTGVGMDEATRQQIFEPFFTTKEPGKGTGLGLANCLSIVEGVGGAIRVESEVGVGTTFSVDLPVCAASVAGVGPREGRERPGRGEEVLVVEDEPALRRAMVRVLRSGGYTVHAAADGTEALGVLDALGGRLEVVLTDVMLRGCSGYDLAEHAARVAPGAAVVLTSGLLPDGARRNHRSDLPLLWKPVSEAELVRAVAESVGRGGRRS